jgi:hypothetical protein
MEASTPRHIAARSRMRKLDTEEQLVNYKLSVVMVVFEGVLNRAT